MFGCFYSWACPLFMEERSTRLEAFPWLKFVFTCDIAFLFTKTLNICASYSMCFCHNLIHYGDRNFLLTYKWLRNCWNCLICRYRNVWYLDTDVGQPEFPAPGFISLTMFDKLTAGNFFNFFNRGWLSRHSWTLK